MEFHCSLQVLLVLNLLPYFCIFITKAQETVAMYYTCPNTTTYNPNSSYQINLNVLLSKLSSNVTLNNKFYYTSVENNSSNSVYGLFMCRGDYPNENCHNCVVRMTSGIIKVCPNQKVAYIWDFSCMLRYHYKPINSTLDTSCGVFVMNTGNFTSSFTFLHDLTNIMNFLATRASNQSTNDVKDVKVVKGFASSNNYVTSSINVYSYVQCTPDLSGADCFTCLRVAIDHLPDCCTGFRGGRVLLPSCDIKYYEYDGNERPRSLETAVILIDYQTSSTRSYPPLLSPPPYPPPPPSPITIQPPSPLPLRSAKSPRGNRKISVQVIILVIVLLVISILLFILVFYFLRIRGKLYSAREEASGLAENDISKAESLQYDLVTIEAATNNFSSENKVGEGGFGEVFKGTLPNGQMVAVKRLSRSSRQGALELKNEVEFVAKLQHRNLVRLIGYCLEREETILIYEYVPNNSLDYFLFDPEKQRSLDWPSRYKIIGGIAQGILYLHEHSRLKVIHRDLKASNVLLDGDMNPKISDFGMARIVGVDISQANTSRIVGTFGYMAPEYVMHGEFSVKSDVFSFGVLLLEIVSGKKRNSYRQLGGSENLLSDAWKHWRDNTPLDLVDPTLGDTCVEHEAVRCINIGLFCVQEDANNRPTMALVVNMLDNTSSIPLPVPHQPAFFPGSRTEAMLMNTGNEARLWSENEASITELYPR